MTSISARLSDSPCFRLDAKPVVIPAGAGDHTIVSAILRAVAQALNLDSGDMRTSSKRQDLQWARRIWIGLATEALPEHNGATLTQVMGLRQLKSATALIRDYRRLRASDNAEFLDLDRRVRVVLQAADKRSFHNWVR